MVPWMFVASAGCSTGAIESDDSEEVADHEHNGEEEYLSAGLFSRHLSTTASTSLLKSGRSTRGLGGASCRSFC